MNATSFPSVPELCRSSGWWFSRAPSWARRHVLTVELKSDRDAVMALVSDVELPHDAEASLSWEDSRRLFLVPVATVSKEARPSHVEVFEESGARAHVLPRRDNASISADAMEHAAKSVFDGLQPRVLERMIWLLRELTLDPSRAAMFYFAQFERDSKSLGSALTGSVEFQTLAHLAGELAKGSMLWVPMVGIPGELKSVRLEYHQKIEMPPLWLPLRRWISSVVTQVRVVDGRSTVMREQLDDANTRGTPRRIWNRIADTIGLSPFQFRIDDAYMTRVFSYHIQVESPHGVDVRRIDLLSTVSWPEGRRGRVYKDTATNRGHLYFSDAADIEPRPAVLINLRVGRHGPLFFSALTSALIATMLWFLAARPEAAVDHDTVAGPTLLVVPALLVVFASRPGEHALVSRLLSGVRLLTLVAGVCAVAAAASLAGALPFGAAYRSVRVSGHPGVGATYAVVEGAFWESVGRNWHYEAVVATVVAAILTVSWLLAFPAVEHVRKWMRGMCGNGARYTAIGLSLLVVQIALAFMMPNRSGHGDLEHILLAVALGAVALLSGWVAAYGEVTDSDRRFASTLLALAATASLVSSLVFLGYDLGAIAWRSCHHLLELYLLAIFLIWFPLMGLNSAAEVRRRRA